MRLYEIVQLYDSDCSDPLEELSYSVITAINYGLFCMSVRSDNNIRETTRLVFLSFSSPRSFGIGVRSLDVCSYRLEIRIYDLRNLKLLLVISKAEDGLTFLGSNYSLCCILATVSCIILQEFFGGFRL